MTIMASMVKPILIVARMFEKPAKQYEYMDKAGEEIKFKLSEFHVLACTPSARYLTGIIKLLQLSNPTKQSPLRVFSAHLIELTEGSAATMLILDDTFETHLKNITHQKTYSNQIADTLEKYKLQSNESVSIQPLQVKSAYNTIHEDVCFLVKEHQINMILLPFHKYPNVHGVLRSENPSLRDVNKNILTHATCPVAVLIERGLSSRTCFGIENKTTYNLAMIFLGGLDDREALAYAYRMARSKNVELRVLRFLLSTDNEKGDISGLNAKQSLALTEEKLERLLDDEYAKEFISKTAHSRSITFMEAKITSAEQIMTTTKTLFNDFDLIIIGKGERASTSLTRGLSSEWNECEELGPLADTLVACEFTKRISILVVKHKHVSSRHRLTKSNNQAEDERKKKKFTFSMHDLL